jgi:hypothetical protein
LSQLTSTSILSFPAAAIAASAAIDPIAGWKRGWGTIGVAWKLQGETLGGGSEANTMRE